MKISSAKVQFSRPGKLREDIFSFWKRFETLFNIFQSGSSDLNNSKVKDSWDLKNKPDGWETTSKGEEDGNIWEMSQREEDILQEHERQIAFNKF
ncbi:hypothetical protein Tco_0191028 [Tanacetum coccineum]